MPHKPPIALTIAGSDSSGGAGIQADIKTFSALGVYAASVVTAVTAQNTQGVQTCQHLPVELIEAQLNSVFSDMTINTVKIGMLGSAATIEAVARAINYFNIKNVIIDPVMVSSSGNRLLESTATTVLTNKLFPLARLITPNLPEAAVLLDDLESNCADDMGATIQRLKCFGATAILLKGGHLEGLFCHDLLLNGNKITQFSHEKVETRNTHGTGCTLSSAICAELAKGASLDEAVLSANRYLQAALLAAKDFHIGMGHGPVHHFHNYW